MVATVALTVLAVLGTAAPAVAATPNNYRLYLSKLSFPQLCDYFTYAEPRYNNGTVTFGQCYSEANAYVSFQITVERPDRSVRMQRSRSLGAWGAQACSHDDREGLVWETTAEECPRWVTTGYEYDLSKAKLCGSNAANHACDFTGFDLNRIDLRVENGDRIKIYVHGYDYDYTSGDDELCDATIISDPIQNGQMIGGFINLYGGDSGQQCALRFSGIRLVT